jgi:DNA mismatch repair protein MutS
MVEMTEAANILHYATSKSLVVLDELGRGTSTFDGLSLAWAISEYLANEIGCRSLIATHYHELTELESLLRGVRNFNVAVREHAAQSGDDQGIAFLHRIVPGGASKSYGIHVARLAGIPKGVIKRSHEVLAELQRGFARESRSQELTREATKHDAQLPLFIDQGERLLDELAATNLEQITPIDALQQLIEWKRKYGK